MTAPVPNRRLAGRIALVTGASRGLGGAIATALGSEGAHVVLAARTVGGLEETDDAIRAAGGTATLVPVDLTDFEQVDRLGAAIYERFGKLDILVGNAGRLGVLTPMGHLDPQVWQQVLDLNLTANYRLIRVCDPLLRRSEAGRALFPTTDVGHVPTAYWAAYAVSKAGLEMMVRTWEAELRLTPIKVALIDPGPVATRLRAAAFPGENPATITQPAEAARAFVEAAL
jgi:NAD(P)-dependent dehydrogenase (short-subunit alcohol dehydrogenase family)